jgi:tetratricopeptide (TPR) repeat protein
VTRTLLGRPISCVGRDREIALLEETFREVREESVARAVLVTGGPGIGKSRLLAELLVRVPEGALVIAGRGDAMAAGASFGLLAPAIRRAAGIHGGEALELRQAKLMTRIAACVPPLAVNRVAAFLGELVSVPFPDDENPPLRAARQDASLMGDAMRTAWEEWLAAECRQRPVVVVLDDLHWGDLPTVRFVDSALRALHESPLFVLAMARPEVNETFPNLWRERSLQQLRLSPLTRRAAQALVREVLGDELDGSTAERVIDRAEGNPFFLEELLITVASGRPNLPETVIGTVQARLDALAPAARRVLRAASVFGTSFSPRGVAVLLGEDESEAIHEWLDDLVHREILVRRQGGDGTELAFRHELVREAAYAMLPPADRRQCHLTAAEWLEWLGETDAVVLGEHLERGGEITRAAAWYRRGAEQALGASDLQAAVDRAELGIALIPEGDPLGALLLVKAEALRWLGEPLAAERHANMAMARLVPGTLPWFHAAGELLTASGRLGNLPLVKETAQAAAETQPFPGAAGERVICLCRAAEQLMAAGEQAAADQILTAASAVPAAELDRLAQARMLRVLSRRDLFAGDVAGYVERQEAAVQALDDAGDHRGACSARSDLGLAYASLGDFRRAEILLREALDGAERRHLVHVAGWSEAHLAQVLPRVDDLGGARLAASRAIELAISHRDRRLEGTARMHLASVCLAEGDASSAEREARAAVELLAISPPRRAAAYAVLARAFLSQHRPELASGASGCANAILGDLGALDEGEISVRLVHAETREALGDREGAAAALKKAHERLGELAKGIWEARLRELYLHAVPDHARTIELAKAWQI